MVAMCQLYKMKRILFLLFILLPVFLTAQVYQVLPQRYEFKDSMKLTKNRNNAAGDSILSTDINGRVINILKPAGGGGGSTDTTSLSNRIDLRVKYTDTAAMLSPYINAADWGLIKTGQRVKADSTAIRTMIGTPTWQQTLTAGSTLNTLNTINLDNNGLNFYTGSTAKSTFKALGDGWTVQPYILGGAGTSFNVGRSDVDTLPYLGIDADSGRADLMLAGQVNQTTDGSNRFFNIIAGNGLYPKAYGNLYYQNKTVFEDTLNATGKVIFSGLPTGKKAKQVFIDTDGTFYQADSTGTGGSGSGISGLTTNELVYGNSATTIQSLPVATYPSLTELSYVKGVTSGVQGQINGLLPLAGATYTTTTGDGLALTSSTVTTGNLMKLTNTGTAAGSNTKNVLAIVSSGANSTSSQTVTGQTISVTNTGTSNINVGLNVTASGAGTGNNYAIKALHGAGGFAFYSDNSPAASSSQFTIQNAGNNITYMQAYNGGSASGGFISMMNQGGYFTVGSPSGSEPLFVDLGSSVVGIGTESATSKLTVNGSFSAKYVAKTANYTATISDYTIDCTSGTFTVTLPTAVGITGRIYVIKNSGAGAITVATTSSQTIDGSTTYTLGTQYKYVVLQSNNSAWIVTGNN